MLHRSRPSRDANLKLQKIEVKLSKLLAHISKPGVYSAAQDPQKLGVKHLWMDGFCVTFIFRTNTESQFEWIKQN
jgi:hypothetical protein